MNALNVSQTTTAFAEGSTGILWLKIMTTAPASAITLGTDGPGQAILVDY
jgi:hypothetical protein